MLTKLINISLELFMNVLVIGSGGREHAIVKALSASKSVSELYAHPGSAAIFDKAETLDVPENSLKKEGFSKLLEAIVQKEIEMAVVGPEAPLVEGLSDFLRENGILVFGPDQEGAKLEGDKIFAKEFLTEFGIPTGSYKEVSNLQSLNAALDFYSGMSPYVFKYKDLAGGKGVLVTTSKDEIVDFAMKFGVSEEQDQVVGYLEEPLHGWELSYICLVNETGYQVCPVLQDHKRLNDGDQGPNTGGMGVAGPLVLDPALEEEIKSQIVEPTLIGLSEREMLYRGVVYFGVMVTKTGPKLLEYNVRFGDPEAQLIFPLVESDWAEIMKNVSLGQKFELKSSALSGCAVVLAAPGYPDSPEKGGVIEGLDKLEPSDLCHAGTRVGRNCGRWKVNGGRVLNILGFGESLDLAIKSAYSKVDEVKFEGMQFRKDIGAKI
jgi:phosphoribosylamine--glycine ligase